MVALALLLGLPPGSLQREADLPEPPEIPAGVPSDLLRRRPDIRQTERTLASSSASIGAAVAELFPKLSLTGTAGFQSQDLSNFTSLSSGFCGFGPRDPSPSFRPVACSPMSMLRRHATGRRWPPTKSQC